MRAPSATATKKFNKTKHVKAKSRAVFGTVKGTQVIPDKRKKPEKHKKPLDKSD